MRHIGGGVAPWNMFRYFLSKKDGEYFVREKETGEIAPLVFYHFQSTDIFRIFGKVSAYYSPYDSELNATTGLLYREYSAAIDHAFEIVRSTDPNFLLGFDKSRFFVSVFARKIKTDMLRVIVRIKAKLANR